MTGCRIASEDRGDPYFEMMEPHMEREHQRDELEKVMDDIIEKYNKLIVRDSFAPCDELISDAVNLQEWLTYEIGGKNDAS